MGGEDRASIHRQNQTTHLHFGQVSLLSCSYSKIWPKPILKFELVDLLSRPSELCSHLGDIASICHIVQTLLSSSYMKGVLYDNHAFF